jgi:hypothetical protein
LTPGLGGQFVPVKRGQGLWFLQINGILIFQNGIVAQTKKSQNHSNCNEIFQFWMVKNYLRKDTLALIKVRDVLLHPDEDDLFLMLT